MPLLFRLTVASAFNFFDLTESGSSYDQEMAKVKITKRSAGSFFIDSMD